MRCKTHGRVRCVDHACQQELNAEQHPARDEGVCFIADPYRVVILGTESYRGEETSTQHCGSWDLSS